MLIDSTESIDPITIKLLPAINFINAEFNAHVTIFNIGSIVIATTTTIAVLLKVTISILILSKTAQQQRQPFDQSQFESRVCSPKINEFY